MKKLLALVLVLGMSSLASASFVTDAPATMTPGQAVTISIGYNTADLNSLGAKLTVTGADVSNFALASPGRDTSVDIPFSAGVFGEAASGATGILANPLATFTLTAGAANTTAVITVMDETAVTGGSFNVAGGMVSLGTYTAQVRCIPEPMTLSLLALGGLAALRRRHA